VGVLAGLIVMWCDRPNFVFGELVGELLKSVLIIGEREVHGRRHIGLSGG
jgi:hypothetical protein